MKKSAKKVLLVEDDHFLSKLYKTKLTQKGYEVELVGDGEACLDYLKDHHPDVILLDIILPKIDGFAVLREIKEHPNTKKIPVVLLTNLGQEEDVKKGSQLGAEYYLVKSNLTPLELVKKIELIWKER